MMIFSVKLHAGSQNKSPGKAFFALLLFLLPGFSHMQSEAKVAGPIIKPQRLTSAQTVIGPPFYELGTFALLAGGQITSNQTVFVLTDAGAVNFISPEITASENVYDYNNGPVQGLLTLLNEAIGHCNSLSGTPVSGSLSGQSLTEGVYEISDPAELTETDDPLILSGDSLSVFIFNINSSMRIYSNSFLILDGVLPENVYWNIADELIIEGENNFSGIVMCSRNILKSGTQDGNLCLLSLSDIEFVDLDPAVGHNKFFSYSHLVSLRQILPCDQAPICNLNVVSNGNFESLAGGPPTDIGNMGNTPSDPSEVCSWRNGHRLSADYHHRDGYSPVDVPSNYHGWQEPNSGDGYAGIIGAAEIGNGAGGGTTREYIRQEIAPMEQGKRYYGEFYVNLANRSRWAINQMGMWISAGHPSVPFDTSSNNTLKDINGDSINAQIKHDGNSFLSDTLNWMKISGCYSATGSETHITIGNFHGQDQAGLSVQLSDATKLSYQAYYYIDDVSLTRLPDAGPELAICEGGSGQIGSGTDCALPASSGVSYSWFPATGLSNDTIANPVASPSVTTTYTLYVTICGSTDTSTVDVIVEPNTSSLDPLCCHAYYSNSSLPYKLNEATPISGAVTANTAGTLTLTAAANETVVFDGSYHISTRLRLTGAGTFKMEPGTILYFDPLQTNTHSLCSQFNVDPLANYLLLDGATLELEGAKLTSTCDGLWGGVFMINQSTFSSAAGPVSTDSSAIHNAYIGLASYQGTTCGQANSNQYFIDNTSFYNNFIGLWDDHKTIAVSGEGVTNSAFYTDSQMHPLYDSSGWGIGHTGIYIGMRDVSYSSLDFDYANASFSGNIFRGLSHFGFDAYMGKNITLSNNTFERIFNVAASLPEEGSNNLAENNYFLLPCIDPFFQVTRIGIFAGNGSTVLSNIIESDTTNPYLFSMPNTATSLTTIVNPASGLDPKRLVGVWTVQSDAVVEDNEFRFLTEGIRSSYGPVTLINVSHVSHLRQNLFHGNIIGVRVSHGNPYHTSDGQVANIRCNTFNDAGVAVLPPDTDPMYPEHTYGLLIMEDAEFNTSLGSTSLPNGNAFLNIPRPVVNDGNQSLTYNRYNTSAENIGLVFGTAGGSIFTGASPTSSTCPGSNGVGRVSGTTYTAIHEMMDSLRYNVGTLDDMRFYLNRIAAYHIENNMVTDLETYANSLPADNLYAYNAMALLLMEHHRAEQNQAAAATLAAAVEANNPGDDEIFWHCRYFDVTGRTGKLGRPGITPDSADLDMLGAIATSGTANSEMACLLLSYYRPSSNCQPYNTNRKMPAMEQVGKGKTNASLLGNSYPNPAKTEAFIPYTLSKGVANATVEIHDLVKGAKLQEYKLSVKEGKGVVTADLQNLSSGVYLYTLIVDGNPVKTEKMVVIK